jgi:hypothetical protein
LDEESGVGLVAPLAVIGTIQVLWNGEPICAHLFAAHAPLSLPDEWVHQVSGQGGDQGMRFHFFWLPYEARGKLWHGFQAGFPLLEQFMTVSKNQERT